MTEPFDLQEYLSACVEQIAMDTYRPRPRAAHRKEMRMTHEESARNNHRSGYNCAQSVNVAFAGELGCSPVTAMQEAPKPRTDGGKCGAFLAGRDLLSKLRPEAVETFEREFMNQYGAVECKKLRMVGCNDLVGTAARLAEELLQ